jgi:hypothetical protein
MRNRKRALSATGIASSWATGTAIYATEIATSAIGTASPATTTTPASEKASQVIWTAPPTVNPIQLSCVTNIPCTCAGLNVSKAWFLGVGKVKSAKIRFTTLHITFKASTLVKVNFCESPAL